MDPTIVSGIFGLGGVVIGSIFSLATVLVSNRAGRRRKRALAAFDQVAGYWNVEDRMARHIHELEEGSRPVLRIKKEFRDRVYEERGIRPTMTEVEAFKLRAEW